MPDYIDLRDDRIDLFTTIGSTERSFRYQPRAIPNGRFVPGLVLVDALYDPALWGYADNEILPIR